MVAAAVGPVLTAREALAARRGGGVAKKPAVSSAPPSGDVNCHIPTASGDGDRLLSKKRVATDNVGPIGGGGSSVAKKLCTAAANAAAAVLRAYKKREA